MKEAFVNGSFREGARLDYVRRIDGLIEEYRALGIPRLTIRQIFYQFVSREWLPNTPRSYILVCDAAKAGRMKGEIDWDGIEDRSRSLVAQLTWTSPNEIIADAARTYQEDAWRGQRYRPELWIEKEALVGVIEDVCDEFRLPIFAAHGYASTSSAYEAGKRFAAHLKDGITPLVLYLGDHDPSGMHMAEDVGTRLSLFARADIEVRRLGLNIDEVRRYRLPPNETKTGGTRTPTYVKEFGKKCWELNALDPLVLIALIRGVLETLINSKLWRANLKREARNRRALQKTAATCASP
jgi:hypothetical protein